MKRVLVVILLLGLMLAMAACGSNKAKPVKPEGESIYYPKWWNSQNSDDYIYSYGIGINLSETSSVNSAKAQALLEASQYVETEVAGMIKHYQEEAGVYDPQLLALTSTIVKVVSNTRFSGTLPGETETRRIVENGGQRYKTWIQMRVPKNEVKKNVMANIRNEEALYNQFKASQAFMELDRELGRN